MTRFRPCIDLHRGQVKQIVGGSLRDGDDSVETNFQSDLSAAHYAALYRKDALSGGHVIQLGPGNDAAAREALAAYPGGLQVGGGISAANGPDWLASGASHVIVTSWLFDGSGRFRPDRLDELVEAVGSGRLVIDLSCRRSSTTGANPAWRVAMNRWQTPTDLELNAQTLQQLAGHCAEFLVHAADVEGKCGGIDVELVSLLGQACPIPVTYAGGARSVEDLRQVDVLSGGRVDLTIGSALDLFGGAGARYADCLSWNRRNATGRTQL